MKGAEIKYREQEEKWDWEKTAIKEHQHALSQATT
jgi:hypothetical protein